MDRELFHGYYIEVDHEVGTFTFHSTWKQNLVTTIAHLIALSIMAPFGVALALTPWFGEPGIPRKDWQIHHHFIFGAMGLLLVLLGLLTLAGTAIILWRLVLKIVGGFPPIVLDRDEGRCREGDQILFVLANIESLEVVDNSDETEWYAIVFKPKDGKRHEFPVSNSHHRWKCEALAQRIGDFLRIPITGK